MSASVSILLPSYNHARFLPHCIQSVLDQSFKDWELIAVDDCSRDESVPRLKSFDDPRIRVHTNSLNLGTYGTLDRALSLSSGEFVAILNSDDAWHPEKLEVQIKTLVEISEAPLVYSLGFRIDEDNQPLESAYASPERSDDKVQEILPQLLDKNDVLASSVVFRRPFARFRPDLRYSGDWVALLSPARNSRVAFVNKPLTFWRMHGANTFRRSPGQVQEEVLIRESILTQASFWQIPRVSKQDLRHGLAACARHLSALYVLQGRMTEARQVARGAVRFEPGKSSLRRLAAVTLPLEKAKRYLWQNEAQVPLGSKKTLIEFS